MEVGKKWSTLSLIVCVTSASRRILWIWNNKVTPVTPRNQHLSLDLSVIRVGSSQCMCANIRTVHVANNIWVFNFQQAKHWLPLRIEHNPIRCWRHPWCLRVDQKPTWVLVDFPHLAVSKARPRRMSVVWWQDPRSLFARFSAALVSSVEKSQTSVF